MKYIIFRVDSDLWTIMYNNFFDDKDIFIIERPQKTCRKLIRGCIFSKAINRRINVPGKRVWLERALRSCTFRNDDDICVLLFDAAYEIYNDEIFDALKKKFSNIKFIFIWENPCDARSLSLYKKISSYIDYTFTFDRSISEEMNWEWYQFPYSGISLNDKDEIRTDLYFLGADKGRFDLLNDIYTKANCNGLICDFNIVGVTKENKLRNSHINYNPLSYRENISRILHTNCLLEIVQSNFQHNTIRAIEALFYRKKLLTTNKKVMQCLDISSSVVRILSDNNLTDEDVEFIKNKLYDEEFPPRESFSPYMLLKKIEGLFYE